MPIQCKACSWRCRGKIEEQRHEHALHCMCNMHILWYLLWPLVFLPNKSSLDFLFIFPVSRPVLTLLSPPRVSPRSLESAASLSHARSQTSSSRQLRQPGARAADSSHNVIRSRQPPASQVRYIRALASDHAIHASHNISIVVPTNRPSRQIQHDEYNTNGPPKNPCHHHGRNRHNGPIQR